MINIGTLIARLRIEDRLTPALAKAQQSLKNAGPKMKAIGQSMTMGVTLPLTAAATAAAVAFGGFEKSMNRVRALTGATGKDFDALSTQAKDLGKSTAFSASEAADAMGFLAMAGFKTTEIVGAMPGVLELAAAAQLDLARAADITSNIMTGYGQTTEDLAHTNNVLVKAMTTANVDLTMLGESMKYVGPVAKSAGVSFEDATAAIALMGNAGIQGSMAGTALRGAITKLLIPTNKAAKEMDALGISALDSEGNLRPLDHIVQQLGESGATTGQMMTIFGQRAGPAMAGLVSQGHEALRDMSHELKNVGSVAQDIAAIQLEGLSGAFTKFKSAANGAMIEVGSHLAPVFTSFLETGITLANWVSDTLVPAFAGLSPTTQKLVIAFAALVTAAGPLLIGLGMLATVLAAVSLPILGAAGLVVAIGAGVAALFAFRKEISEFIKKGVNLLVEGFDNARVWLGLMSEETAAARKIERDFTAALKDQIPVVEGITLGYQEQAPAIAHVATELDEAKSGTKQLDEATKELNKRINEQVTAWRQGGIPAGREAMVAFAQLGGEISQLTDSEVSGLNKALSELIDKSIRTGRAVPQDEFDLWVKTLDRLNPRVLSLSDALDDMPTLPPDFLDIPTVPLDRALDGFAKLNDEVVKGQGVFGKWGDSVKGGFKDLWSGMTGGTGKISGLFSSLGAGIVEGFGQIISGGLTSIINAAVGLAMKGLGKLWSWIKGKFGVSEAEKEARQLVSTFEATVTASLSASQRGEAGGRKWAEVTIGVRDAYLLAGRSAAEAEAQVQRLWDAQKRGPAAVQEVINSIQHVLDLAAEIQQLTDDSIQGLVDLVAEGRRSGELLPKHLEPYLATLVEVGKLTQSDMDLLMKMSQQATYDWREVQAAADRYGVSVEHLGKRFQAQKWGEKSAQIAADWELMAVKGAKANKVARAMAPTVQATIDQYQKAGIKIPHALKSIIEKQISMGLLEDENGRKLKSSSEIEFADPIVSEFDKLIKAIEALINKLTGRGGVVDSFHKVNDTQIEDKEFTVTENRNVNRTGGGTDDDSMFMRHGTGGRYVDFGAGTPAVLHGKERVMTEAEGKSEVASMHGVEKRLTSIERLLKDQPRAFGLAMSDTMNLLN